MADRASSDRDTAAVVTAFLESGAIAADLIAHLEVGARWNDDSVLRGYRVGALAAHLGRALTTVDDYLGGDPPSSEAEQVDAVGYFTLALQDHDPIISDFHAKVRARGERAAEEGHDAVVALVRETLERLRVQAIEPAQPVGVLAGITIGLGQYLETRLVELLIHSRDLSDSIGIDPPAFPEAAWAIVADLLARTAIARNGPEAVALALARSDRMPAVRAF